MQKFSQIVKKGHMAKHMAARWRDVNDSATMRALAFWRHHMICDLWHHHNCFILFVKCVISNNRSALLIMGYVYTHKTLVLRKIHLAFQESDRKVEEERIRTENILKGNPLMNNQVVPEKSDFKVKRRWVEKLLSQQDLALLICCPLKNLGAQNFPRLIYLRWAFFCAPEWTYMT